MENTFRLLTTATLAKPSMRYVEFSGRKHLVVPVVALVADGVYSGMLSEEPEFIPARILAAAPATFDGRHVLAYHPKGTANTPELLDSAAFGTVFNSRFEKNALQCEAWLDLGKTAEAGDDAVEVLADLIMGQSVAVSIGAWVAIEKRRGTAPNGKQYGAVWASVPIYDHLAVGLRRHGGVGACGIDQCAANRILTSANLSNGDKTMCKCSSNGKPLTDEQYNATQRDPWNVPATLAAKLNVRQEPPVEKPAADKGDKTVDPWARHRAR